MLTGGRLTLEDAYAYAKFTRVALDTNDIDMRARPHSAEEEQFLAAWVAGRDIEVSYADLEAAPAVLLAGFEPEDESPIVFLRLRKAAAQARSPVFSIAALATPGLAKLSGTLLPTVPGAEAAALTALAAGGAPSAPEPGGGTVARTARRTGSGRPGARRTRRGDPRRRAAGRGARRARRRGPARDRRRRAARLDPAPGGGARRRRGRARCPACCRSAAR